MAIHKVKQAILVGVVERISSELSHLKECISCIDFKEWIDSNLTPKEANSYTTLKNGFTVAFSSTKIAIVLEFIASPQTLDTFSADIHVTSSENSCWAVSSYKEIRKLSHW